MQEAFNFYVTKVLDVMVESGIPMDRAKTLCRKKIQKLERCYYRLDAFDVAARRMSRT